jgi:hypothetical protein
LVVAAVVTPLASRLTTAATRTEKLGFWSMGDSANALGLALRIFTLKDAVQMEAELERIQKIAEQASG